MTKAAKDPEENIHLLVNDQEKQNNEEISLWDLTSLNSRAAILKKPLS